ncbi:hypothetical protein [Aliirhizobium cellulosilyticum]|uniref:Uncharacterized protein n=1 Tax=Aliirhizobium cellulosilyticum TaxID=393664 RepID=A0A7W6TFS5_9HYPH|nr:hypothetical protein [Rhizobium cellulosilyticum]MBB4349286.1 hypothetical protein [Rhizobium cellulosilyticum]MBB4412492.1 hypothetical protein [Rhizobium cellulosilyticum]MBB4447124.1 hypothetical protein [Rhizobium cellulosilyticum]
MDLKRFGYMDTIRPKGSGSQSRKAALDRLRQIELIELSLDFNLDSLLIYADSVAKERQDLTSFLLDESHSCHKRSTCQAAAASTARKSHAPDHRSSKPG